MSRNIPYLFPVVLLLLFFLRWLDFGFGILPTPSLNERRQLADAPTLRPDFLDPFPRDYEAYFNDHFIWRNHFVRANSFLNYYTFKKSAVPEKVVIGQEDWLFKGGFQLDIYRGKFRFSHTQLKQLVNEFKARKDSVMETGGRYYVAFAPLKHGFYEEYLPPNIRRLNTEICTEQLMAALRQDSTIDFIDIRQPLLDFKQRYPDSLLYYRTDHHWNQTAGLLAAQAILRHVRHDFPQLDTLRWEDYQIKGDASRGMTLAEMLGMEAQLQEWVPVLHPQFALKAHEVERHDYLPPADFPYPDDYFHEMRTDRPHLPSIFINRESFGGFVRLPLAEHFDRSIWLFDNWEHRFNGDVYRAEDCDIYLQLVWEGMIYTLLDPPLEDAGW